MGGGSRTTTQQQQQQTQQQVMDPEIRAAFLGNYNRAVGVADGLQERQFAGFTPDQLAAFEATRNAVGAGNQNFGNASGALNGLLNFDPGTVNATNVTAPTLPAAIQAQAAGASASLVNRGDIRDVTAGLLRDTDLSAYMNPYTTGVIDSAMSDLERSRLTSRSADAARFAKAGAFGGSRQGVVEAETNRAYDDNTARTVAGLRQSAFQNAQQAAMGDIGNQMAAQQANQGVDFGVGSTNANNSTQARIASAQMANQTNLANAAAQNQFGLAGANMAFDANRFNSQQGLAAQQANMQGRLGAGQLGLSAAGQLGQLAQAQQQSGLLGAQALAGVGGMQQQLEQARLDAARGLDVERMGVINNSLGFLDPSMGATVNSSGSSSGSSRTRETMGLGQIAGLGMQAFSLFPSDERLKEDIKPLGGGLHQYTMKDTGEKQIGLLAQEVEERDPGAVKTGADGYKRVDYARATDGLLAGPLRAPKKKKGKKNVR